MFLTAYDMFLGILGASLIIIGPTLGGFKYFTGFI
jgi:hypothetical protein